MCIFVYIILQQEADLFRFADSDLHRNLHRFRTLFLELPTGVPDLWLHLGIAWTKHLKFNYPFFTKVS